MAQVTDGFVMDEADTEVGADEPPEKVVRGVIENVGLAVDGPPASEIVIAREALRLLPQDEVDPDASENAILEGALNCVLGSCSVPIPVGP